MVTQIIRDLELQKLGRKGTIAGFMKMLQVKGNPKVSLWIVVVTAYITNLLSYKLLLTTLIVGCTTKLAFQVTRNSPLCYKIDVLNPLKRPTGILSPWVHRESQLASLRGRLSVDFWEIRGQFRDFIVKTILNTLPVSSADCERRFSAMNVIRSDLRNALTVQHMSNLMFISLEGPPVSKFKPNFQVEQWLMSHRRTDYKKREQERKSGGLH